MSQTNEEASRTYPSTHTHTYVPTYKIEQTTKTRNVNTRAYAYMNVTELQNTSQMTITTDA